jgi:hypothetical protein
MELLIMLIIVGVGGYLLGRYLRGRSNSAASEQVVDTTAKDVTDTEN